jgi:RNA polymerase sigma-70 factor (ECF subfamily)
MQSIVEVIDTLSDGDRDIIQLRYFYNYSEKEIAQMLDFKYDAVRKRLQRAKNKLGKLLREKGE